MTGSIATRLPFIRQYLDARTADGRAPRATAVKCESTIERRFGRHRSMSSCLADGRKRRVSGSACIRGWAAAGITGRHESSCWQTGGTSSFRAEKPADSGQNRIKTRRTGLITGPALAQVQIRIKTWKPRQCGEHADIRSPRSVTARLADDTDGRPNSRCDPMCADRAGFAPALVAPAVGTIGDIAQHRDACL